MEILATAADKTYSMETSTLDFHNGRRQESEDERIGEVVINSPNSSPDKPYEASAPEHDKVTVQQIKDPHRTSHGLIQNLFPPSTLYNTLNTPEAWRKHPGSPAWKYDGQFIWIVKER